MKLYQTTNHLVLMILFCSTFISLCVQTFYRLLLDLTLLQLLKVFPRVLFRLLFNFQDTDAASVLRRATLLSYHTFCFLSSLFRDIFCRPLFIGQLIHNTTFFNDCQGVFSNFEPFRELLHIHQKPAYFFVHSVKQTCKSIKKEPHIVQFFEGADRI